MKRFLTIILAGAFALSASAVSAQMLEDFEDGDISDWLFTGSGIVTAYTSPGAAHDGALGLICDASDWMYRTAGISVSQGSIISYWARTNNGTWQRQYLGFGSTAAGTYSAVIAQNTGEFIIQLNAGYGYSNLAAVPFVPAFDTWYRVEVHWGVGGQIDAYCYASDGTTLLASVSTIDNTYVSGGIALRAFGGTAPSANVNHAGKGTRSFSAFDTIEDLSGPVAVESASWASVKGLYR